MTRKADLGAVREARRNLDALAKKHPELTGERGPENVAGWERTLSMAENTVQIAVRMPVEMVERIDRYAEMMGNRTPGLKPARADAVRVLLTIALAVVEKQKVAKP